MNGQKGVRAIVLAGKKLPQLEFFELMDEAPLLGRDFLLGCRAMGWIGFLRRELAQRFEIRNGALEFAQRIQERTEARNFLDVPLGPLAVRPEIGGGHALFESGELAF